MGSDAELQTLLDGLRPHLDRLAVDLRPAPVHMPPLPWQSEPIILRMASLAEEPQRDLIQELLESSHGVMQAVAVHLISDGQHRDLLDHAIALVEAGHPHDAFATMVVAAIGRLDAQEHKPTLRAALDRPPTFWAAVESLALLGGDDVMADLERAVAKPGDAWDRLDVISVIGHVGGQFAVPILSGILLDSSETFVPARGYAAQALGARGEQSALPALLKALQDPTMTEKGRVLWGIAQLGGEEAFDQVVPFVHEAEKDWYRGEAIKAAVACNANRAWPLLVKLLDEDDYFRSDSEAFLEAVRALGHVQRPHAGQRLLHLLSTVLQLESSKEDALESQVRPLPSIVQHAGDRFLLVVLETVGDFMDLDLTLHETPRNITDGANVLLERLAEHDADGALPVAFSEVARQALTARSETQNT